ncbi:MAG TPA: hypothetical protein PKL44_01900, partial [Candidatus Dojkabacteria bacterium]|nr:hypothetical protein [Candidatus Dojkabacteria bacterium]
MNIQDILKDKKKLPLLIAGVALLLIILMVIILLLASKGKDPSNTEKEENGTPSETRELVYWGLWESTEVMEEIIDEFETNHPGVTIKYSMQTFKDYESRLYSRLQQTATTSNQLLMYLE